MILDGDIGNEFVATDAGLFMTLNLATLILDMAYGGARFTRVGTNRGLVIFVGPALYL